MWLVANPEERPQEDFDILSHEGSTSLKGTLAIQARQGHPVRCAETLGGFKWTAQRVR